MKKSQLNILFSITLLTTTSLMFSSSPKYPENDPRAYLDLRGKKHLETCLNRCQIQLDAAFSHDEKIWGSWGDVVAGERFLHLSHDFLLSLRFNQDLQGEARKYFGQFCEKLEDPKVNTIYRFAFSEHILLKGRLDVKDRDIVPLTPAEAEEIAKKVMDRLPASSTTGEVLG